MIHRTIFLVVRALNHSLQSNIHSTPQPLTQQVTPTLTQSTSCSISQPFNQPPCQPVTELYICSLDVINYYSTTFPLVHPLSHPSHKRQLKLVEMQARSQDFLRGVTSFKIWTFLCCASLSWSPRVDLFQISGPRGGVGRPP